MATLLIIAAAAIYPVCATTSQKESEAEAYVLEKLQKGEHADLEGKFPKDRFPESKRELSAFFIKSLLTNRDAKLKIDPQGIWIQHAVITGSLNLESQDISYDVVLRGCMFAGNINFFGSNFARGLELSDCTFKGDANFYGTTIRQDFLIYKSKFESANITLFDRAQVGGLFVADDCTFDSSDVSFNDARVDGRFSAKRCIFNSKWVSFIGAHFADLFLNGSEFHKFLSIDFTRMQADFISFDEVTIDPPPKKPPSEILLQQMTFKLLSPVDPQKLQFLFSSYNAEFYTALETSFRTHGYPAEADNIFIAKKRAERRAKCTSFVRNCDSRLSFTWSMFQDLLIGYGKSLQNLLFWSLGFILIGIFFFRSENVMRTKDPKDAEQYKGKYHAFWYSLDLFLPVIKLGEADVWTPKDNRRWANLYRKVHIIIGSLFVPIGLAAWTGIIK